MDGTGNFSGSSDANDEGVETPLNIGTDERRMHVRAYNYWVSLLEGRAYPSIEDLDPENIEDFGPNSVLLDFTGGIENPAISFLGNKLREACELPVGVQSVAEIPSRSLLSRLTDHYMQIIANRAPIGFEAEFTNDAGNEIMYRGILMPFSSDDDTIDFIYGVINWKEGADGELASSLASEVERALQDVPAPRNEPTAPAWADGPSTPASSRDADADVRFDADDDDDDDVLPLDAFAEPVAAPELQHDEPAELPEIIHDSSESLADWLAAARSAAEEAGHADLRSRVALYRALGEAYDFALTARDRPDEYKEILADAHLVVQPRAPMTPIVKLVFGIGYDKTRLAEYGLALTHAQRSGVGFGRFRAFIETYSGGLKGIIQTERAARRPDPASKQQASTIERARILTARGIVEIQGSDEFVILVARRVDEGHVAVLGQVEADDKALERALRQLVK
jgi:hypothetical protein